MVKKKTEKLIQEKFLKLLESKSIDEIDINMICKNLKIKRQTFYYHYKNIYDVILSFYFDDSIEYKSVKYEEIVQETVNYLFKNEEFNREVSHSNAKDILNEFIYSNLYKTMILYLKKYKLNISQKKEESVFISKCLTDYVLYLFENENNTQEEIVEKIGTFLSEDIVLNITKSYISSLKYKK